ncbi:MAG: hypothetical protein ACFFDF_20960 [Candidatus Odinarchaeota archaeon]
MIRGHLSSSESQKCIVCGKLTSDYVIWHESGITIQIPVHTGERYPIIENDIERAIKAQFQSIKSILKLAIGGRDK